MSKAVAAAVAAPNALYSSRWERSFEVGLAEVDRIQALVAQHLPLDTEFPNPQPVHTTYIRSASEDGPKGKARIRTYPGSPEAPAFLEFKDGHDIRLPDGTEREIKLKTRAVIDHGVDQRLLWGDSAAELIGTTGRSGEDLITATRGIDLIDRTGLHPVMRGEYERTTLTNLDDIRITFDRNIAITGIGELAGSGTVARPHAIMDVKTTGKVPRWLTSLIDTEVAAGSIKLVENGKGGTAVAELAARLVRVVPK